MSSSRLNKLVISFARKWKWQRVCGISIGRRSIISKGDHFVVYTLDSRRFVFPLAYLETDMFRELLRLSEQVFGLPADAPITLPCHSLFLEQYCVCLASSIQNCHKEAISGPSSVHRKPSKSRFKFAN